MKTAAAVIGTIGLPRAASAPLTDRGTDRASA